MSRLAAAQQTPFRLDLEVGEHGHVWETRTHDYPDHAQIRPIEFAWLRWPGTDRPVHLAALQKVEDDTPADSQLYSNRPRSREETRGRGFIIQQSGLWLFQEDIALQEPLRLPVEAVEARNPAMLSAVLSNAGIILPEIELAQPVHLAA